MSSNSGIAGTTERSCALIVGASGYIGTHLVPALVAAGYKVRAAARNGESLSARFVDPVERVTLDLLEPKTLPAALAGVDIAYYLVHSMQAGDDYAARDLRAARIFAKAAEQAGIKRIIYLGAVSQAATNSEHLISRRETGEALRNGMVPVIELRAPIIVGPGSAPFEAIRDMVNHLPGTLLPVAVKHKSAPIALQNLLNYLTQIAELAEAEGEVFEVAGPEMISYHDQIKRYAAVAGKRFFTLCVPGLGLGLVRLAMPLFSSAPSGVVRALLGGLREDMPNNDQQIRQLISQPLLGYEEGIRAALLLEQNQHDPLQWFQGNCRYREGWPNSAYYGDRLILRRETALSAHSLWKVLSRIGGTQRFFYMNWVWAIREWMDACVGGPGRKLGRDTVDQFVVGERVDSWEILDVEANRRVVLGFRMKGPGSGTLEFRLTPLPGQGTEISMLAYWHPAGFPGQLYWFTMMRPHTLLFHGMLRELERLAGIEQDNEKK